MGQRPLRDAGRSLSPNRWRPEWLAPQRRAPDRRREFGDSYYKSGWKERSRLEIVAALVQQWRRVEEEDVAHPVAAGLWERRLTFGSRPSVPPHGDIGGRLVPPVRASDYIFVNVIRAGEENRLDIEEKDVGRTLLSHDPTEGEAEQYCCQQNAAS